MLRKIAFGISAFLLLLFVLVLVLPVLYKDQIKAKLLQEVNKKINAQLQIGDVSATLFRHFPLLTLEVEEVKLWGKDQFKSDTLLSLKSIGLSMNLMEVIKGENLSIRKFSLSEGTINLIELRDSSANWKITFPDSLPEKPIDTSTSAFKFSIESYKFSNLNLLYTSELSGMKADLQGLSHEGSGDFNQDEFVLKTLTEVKDFSLTYKGVKYLNHLHAKAEVPININSKQSKYTFTKNEFSLNDLKVHFDGWLQSGAKAMDMDLSFSTPQTEFKYLLSLIPALYTNQFDKLKTSGSFVFNSRIKGQYEEKKSIPSFQLGLKVKDGFFQYPSLPAAVKAVNLELSLSNPDGVVDNTVINLKHLHADLGGNPLDFSLDLVKPLSDPTLTSNLKLLLDLTKVKTFYPLPEGQDLKGMVKADLTAGGKVNALKKKDFKAFTFSGLLELGGFYFRNASFPQGMQIEAMKLLFSPAVVKLAQFNGTLAGSDLQADGYIDNLLFYFLKNEPLKGSFNLRSQELNLNAFMSKADSSEETPEATETTALKIIEVPANIDFTLNAALQKVIYDNLTISDLSGNLKIKDRQLGFHDLNFNLLGGTIQSTGTYSTKIINKPEINFDLSMQNFDMQQCVKTFVSFEKIAPVAPFVTGNFTTAFRLAGFLKEDMTPDLMTLTGGGLLKMKTAGVAGYPPALKLSEMLNIQELKELQLKDLKLSFEFENGRVFVAPFDMKLAGMNTRVSGSNGFDKTIDYIADMSIPRARLGQANDAVKDLLNQANAFGVKITLNDVIPVRISITGTVDNPKIKTDLKQAAGNMADQLKNQAQEELQRRKKELEEKARMEAEKVRQDLENKRRETEQRAQDEADKLKKEAERKKAEAEQKAKAEAERLKKEAEEKAKEEAKKRLKGLLPR